jgi:hypothetical protein
LSFKESDFQGMRKHLLQDDGLERASFIFLGARVLDSPEELFVHKVINIRDEDLDSQTPVYVLPKMSVLLEVFKRFGQDGSVGLMHVHSHPFDKEAQFSGTDRRSARNAVRSLNDYLLAGQMNTPFLFGMLVMGQNPAGFSGYLQGTHFESKGEVGTIKTVSSTGIPSIHDLRGASLRGNEMDHSLLDRNIRWMGVSGQERLSSTHLAICGLGGVGGLAALNARGLGFKKITLVDHDCVETSNLNRLPAATRHDVGSFKVEVMKRMIEDVSSGTEVVAIQKRVEEAREAVVSADIILSAVDNFKARFGIQLLAARYLKPLVDVGSGITLGREEGTVNFIGGQVVWYVPGGPCLCCQGVIPWEIESDLSLEVKRATGYVQGTEMTPSSVVTINSIMAGHAMDMLVRYITGFSEIRPYLRCDLLRHTYQTFNFQKKTGCMICGDEGVEGKGDEWEQILPNKMWGKGGTGYAGIE